MNNFGLIASTNFSILANATGLAPINSITTSVPDNFWLKVDLIDSSLISETTYSILSFLVSGSFLVIALIGKLILSSKIPELIASRTGLPKKPFKPMIVIETLDIAIDRYYRLIIR